MVFEVNGFGVLAYKQTSTGNEYLLLKYAPVHNGRRVWGNFWGIPLGVIENSDEDKSVKKLLKKHTNLDFAELKKLNENEDYTTVIKGVKVRKKVNYYLAKIKEENIKLDEKYDGHSFFKFQIAWNKARTPTLKKVLTESKQYLNPIEKKEAE